jgi:hypothetical protein
MQFSDGRIAGSGQVGKNVAFSLSDPQAIQIDADTVRGAVNFRN